jgi:hypothetical protein
LKITFYEWIMAGETETRNSSGFDKGLVAMFLKMSPEERLKVNDNAVGSSLFRVGAPRVDSRRSEKLCAKRP